MQPTILISKAGGTLWTREMAHRMSADGEQGCTEGVVRHLCERDDVNVVYYGKAYGDLPCQVIDPCMEPLARYNNDPLLIPAEAQYEAWAIDNEQLEKLQPIIGYITTGGYASGNCRIDNPQARVIQCCALRYQAHMIQALEHFELPRFVINSDLRTYPKNQEMIQRSHFIQPRALLDQTKWSTFQSIYDVKMSRRSVYARCETWNAHDPRPDNTRELSCVSISNAHIKTGMRSAGRADAWSNIFGGYDLPPDLKIYGNGWEHWDWYDPELCVGEVKPSDVLDILHTSRSAPVIAQAYGYYTSKPYICHSVGCVPLLYGSGQPFTWDPLGELLPLDDPWRINEPGDLRVRCDWLSDDNIMDEQLERWAPLCRADWRVLDSLIDDLLAGGDPTSEEWYMTYGGYRRRSDAGYGA